MARPPTEDSDDDRPTVVTPKSPPILAYSDDEDEPPAAAGGADNAGDEVVIVGSSSSSSSSSAGGTQPLAAATQQVLHTAGAALIHVGTWLRPADVAMVLPLVVVRRVSRRASCLLESCALLAALRTPLARATGRTIPLPARLAPQLQLLAGLSRAVLLHVGWRRFKARAQRRRLQRVSTSIADEVLERASLERAALERSGSGPPSALADYSTYFATELQELKRILLARNVELPVDRFDRSNTELMRFALACGIHQARSVAERKMALGEAVLRVSATAKWAARQHVLSNAELRKWEALVRWCRDDSAGRGVLLVRLGRALERCHGKAVQHFVAALISTVQVGTLLQVRRGGSALEQVVVVCDCRGANSLVLAQRLPLIKAVAAQLSQHYPQRLHRVFLVEVPALARFALAAVLSALPAATRARVRVVGQASPELPLRLCGPDLRRLSAGSLGTPHGSLTNLAKPRGGLPLASSLPPPALPFSPRDASSSGTGRGSGGAAADSSGSGTPVAGIGAHHRRRPSRVSFTPEPSSRGFRAPSDDGGGGSSGRGGGAAGGRIARTLSADCLALAGGQRRGMGLGIGPGIDEEYAFDSTIECNGASGPAARSTRATSTATLPAAPLRAEDVSSAVRLLMASMFVVFVALAATARDMGIDLMGSA